MALTEAGALLYRHATQIFAAERAAEVALAQLHGLEHGHLAIGASSTIGIYLLPKLLGIYRRRHPKVQLFLDIGNTQQIVERLHTKPLDMAFVEGPVSASDIRVKPWRTDRLVVIAAPNHPLVEQEIISLHRLLREPFVMREPGSGTREVAEAAVRERDGTLKIAMELGSTEAVKQAVAAGLGLAIVSEATIIVERAIGRLTVLPVAGLEMERMLTQLFIVGRPESRALAAFQSLLAEPLSLDEAPISHSPPTSAV
jgi:DNA-binding transcriptional LysR family regulator